MSKEWSDFVRQVEEELRTSQRGFINLDQSFVHEQTLTRETALGLRKLFIAFFGTTAASEIHHHVVYRKGDTDADKVGWTASQSEKWINVYGPRWTPKSGH